MSYLSQMDELALLFNCCFRTTYFASKQPFGWILTFKCMLSPCFTTAATHSSSHSLSSNRPIPDKCVHTVLCYLSVCTSGGYAVSFWNRPFFPEWCSDSQVDNKTTYNTIVRLSGSYTRLGIAFEAMMRWYGWRRAALVSDTTPATCYYGAKSISDRLGAAANFTFYWWRVSTYPSVAEIDDTLRQIRDRDRSESL